MVFVPIILWFVGGVAEHRFFEFINRFLDAHESDFVARVRPVLIFKGPFMLAAIGLAIVFLVLVIRAYFTSKPAIVGVADLMLQELDISDLEIANDMSYKVNAAVFARIEVAVLDRPRTIKHFEIEMIAPDATRYSAKSEYELGLRSADNRAENSGRLDNAPNPQWFSHLSTLDDREHRRKASVGETHAVFENKNA